MDRRARPRASPAAGALPNPDYRFDFPCRRGRTLPQELKLCNSLTPRWACCTACSSFRSAARGARQRTKLRGKSMNRNRVVPALLAAATLISCGPQGSSGLDRFKLDSQKAPLRPQGALTDVLPDMQPWSYEEVATFGLAYANSNDRLVSCDDWTQISPDLITGQRIITFQLGSANLGLGHLRIRRGPLMPDGWHFFQTTSQIDGAGTCSATEQEIAIVPPDQNGRWLPLASFSLYTELDDASVGDLVVFKMKRWCCLCVCPTCNTLTP